MYHIYSQIPQQPLLQSNVGRLCTSVRWQVEKVIGLCGKRYMIFKRMPFGWILFGGISARYIISTHIQFGIGYVKSTIHRRFIMSYMHLTMHQWSEKHPISTAEFNQVINCCRRNMHNKGLAPNEQHLYRNNMTHFKLWNNDFVLSDYWDPETINYFVFNFGERIVKSGGIGNIRKADSSLWASKDIIACFVGTGFYKGIIVVNGIRMRMKIVNVDDQLMLQGRTSTCMIKLLDDDTALHNVEHLEFEFPPKILKITGRCSNIYGRRTISFCSHLTTSMYHFFYIYIEIE